MRRFLRNKWVRYPFVFLLSLLILLGGFGLCSHSLLQSVSAFLVHESVPQSSDLVCALGGDEYRRIEKAIQLYKEGLSTKLFFALPEGVADDIYYRDLIQNEKRICEAILEFHQIPVEDVLWSATPFYSTAEEIQYIGRLMDEHRFRSAIIVPGWFQSRRAKWTADRLLGDNKTIWIVPAPEDRVPCDAWWTDMNGFIMVENECLKNIYYFFRH